MRTYKDTYKVKGVFSMKTNTSVLLQPSSKAIRLKSTGFKSTTAR